MKALLWKDFRINIPILIAAVVVWCIVQPLAILNVVLSNGRGDVPLVIWAVALTLTNLASLTFSQLLVGALAANAFAAERSDRSAEFLFALPPARGRILLSKLIVALGLAAGLWLAHLFILEIVIPIVGNSPPLDRSTRTETYQMTFAAAVCLFGGSWLGSSLLKSAAYSLLAGIALLGATGGAILNFQVLLKLPHSEALEAAYKGSFLLLGLVSFIAGTIYYLRRVEP
jgi:ABC-type transport system involved in multi-copper enzyme maturation permease subunit